MILRIDKKDVDGVTVLKLKGRLVLGDESRALGECIKQLVAEQKTRILVNLEELVFIDSCGVGELIAGFTSLKKNGGILKLSQPTDHVGKVLHLVRLPAIIEIHKTDQEALASFKA